MKRLLNRREFLSAAVLAGAGLGAGRAHAGGKDEYYFMVAADPQLWWKEDQVRDWERAVEVINSLDPDFLLICGDLLSVPNEVSSVDWGRADRMAEAYLKVENDLDVPYYHVAGNHDVCRVPVRDTVDWYERRFGKLYYSFEHKGSLYIGLDSNMLGFPDNVRERADEQLAWLEGILQSAKKKKYGHIVMFMHHPPFVKSIEEQTAYQNIPSEIRKRLMDMCVAFDVEMIFSGHLHANAYSKYKGVELITTASCCHTHKHPMGLRIVKVAGHRIYDKFYSFENMPKRLSDFSIKRKT